MRFLVPLIVLVLATACGAGDPRAPETGAPASEVEVRGPSASAPQLVGFDGPPPAWIETERGKLWLAYATFCWPGCADYPAPVCGDERYAPTIVVRRAEVVRFHLGFDPRTHVSLRFFANGKARREIRLAAADRTPTWEVDRAGPFWIDVAKRQDGSASYAGCFKLAS